MSGAFLGTTFLSRVIAGLIGSVVALIAIVIITYIIHLLLALIRQRNEARDLSQKQAKQIEEQKKLLLNERNHLNSELLSIRQKFNDPIVLDAQKNI